MSVLKKYNEGTSQWEAVVIGKQGNSGVVSVTAPITNSGTSTSAVLSFDTNFLGQAAGKNYVINGGFDFWQRGTSFSHSSSSIIYNADRWGTYRSGFAAGSTTTRQSSGLTGFQYSARVQRDSGNTSTAGMFFANAFETVNSILLAGQPVTLSFYAKAGANFSSTTLAVNAISGTGTDQTAWAGFSGYANAIGGNPILTTSWQKFTFTGTMASNATQLGVLFSYTPTGTAGANDWFEVAGVQLERGSVATPFSRAGGTIQGELAACQRYLPKFGGSDNYEIIGTGWSTTANYAEIFVPYKVNTRVSPSAIEYSSLTLFDGVSSIIPVISLTVAGGGNGTTGIRLVAYVAGGLTQYRPYELLTNNTTAGYLRLPAEL